MAHIHIVTDSDTRFVIDPVTRQLKNGTKKLTLVKGDHNSERFTFEIPRKVEEHDMSECNRVEVHYINVGRQGKTEDVYVVDDLDINPDDQNTVLCSWLISGNATKYAGTLNFVVMYKCLTEVYDETTQETTYTVDYSWSTAIYSGITISDGISNTSEVFEDYADIMLHWFNKLESAADNLYVITDDGVLINVTSRVAYIESIIPETNDTVERIEHEYNSIYQQINGSSNGIINRLESQESKTATLDTGLANLRTEYETTRDEHMTIIDEHKTTIDEHKTAIDELIEIARRYHTATLTCERGIDVSEVVQPDRVWKNDNAEIQVILNYGKEMSLDDVRITPRTGYHNIMMYQLNGVYHITIYDISQNLYISIGVPECQIAYTLESYITTTNADSPESVSNGGTYNLYVKRNNGTDMSPANVVITPSDGYGSYTVNNTGGYDYVISITDVIKDLEISVS